MQRMSGVDAAFWHGETPPLHLHVGTVAVLETDGVPGFCLERVRDLVVERLPELPKLSWRVAEAPLGVDRPWFVEDPDLDELLLDPTPESRRPRGLTARHRAATRRVEHRSPRFLAAPPTRFNAPLSPHRTVAAVRLDLARVTALHTAYDVTVHDVVLALVAGALRHYLGDREGVPARPLIARTPISTRGGGGAEGAGNAISPVTVSLATDVSDPAERIAAIGAGTRGARPMAAALGARRIMELSDVAPLGLLHAASRAYARSALSDQLPPINLVVASAPGPQAPLHLAGAPLRSLLPIGPLVLDVALSVTAVSYLDSIDLGFVTAPEVARDVRALADAVPLALGELERAADLGPTTAR